MVKIIMGLKGSGKTKKLVELVREAVNVGDGDVVCIEKDRKLTYDIPYQARLIDAGAYAIGTYEFLKGFISGTAAFGVGLLMWGLCNMEMLMENIHTMDLKQFAVDILLRYMLFLFIYLVAVFMYAHKKYTRARKEVKGYNRHLKRLIGSFERDGGES